LEYKAIKYDKWLGESCLGFFWGYHLPQMFFNKTSFILLSPY